jgi:hypothetical protein
MAGPSEFQNFLENTDAFSDATNALNSATTQDARNAALQILTQLCQKAVASIFVFENVADPFLLFAWLNQQIAAQKAVNACTDLSESGLNLWDTESLSLAHG